MSPRPVAPGISLVGIGTWRMSVKPSARSKASESGCGAEQGLAEGAQRSVVTSGGASSAKARGGRISPRAPAADRPARTWRRLYGIRAPLEFGHQSSLLDEARSDTNIFTFRLCLANRTQDADD